MALSDELLMALPSRFEAVGEALASGSGLSNVCAVVGRELARDGVSLEETLQGLRRTCRLVLGSDPAYVEVEAVSVAWSEATLAYLHQLSCEDPLTGLSSLAHVRSRLTELYRGQLREDGDIRDAWALVVVDRGQRPGHGAGQPSPRRCTRAGWGTSPGRSSTGARPSGGSVPTGWWSWPRATTGSASGSDCCAGCWRARSRANPRVWIEGLPATDAAVALLLDELARS